MPQAIFVSVRPHQPAGVIEEGLTECYTAPPIQKARTRFGLFHICRMRQFWRDFADLPRERCISHSGAFCPLRPLCFSFLSGCLASVREATS